VTNFLGSAQSVAPASTPSTLGAQQRTSDTPTISSEPAPEQPKLLALPKLPALPKPKPPTVESPKPPKLPITSSQSTAPRGLNLGLLVPAKPTVVAGGGAAGTNAPTFGGDRAAGVISGALKKLADGLTGKKPADAASPAA
jgi:hypothetical protein